MALLFGTAGIPHAAKQRSTADGIKAIRELGLDAMEVQFVRGVKMSEKKARDVEVIAKSLDVALSVHAPYYINLNADEKKKQESIQRLIDSARIGAIFNATSIVFHAGYYLKSSKERAYERIRESIRQALDYVNENKLSLTLRPETTGKPTQFGDIDELIKLSNELDIQPCIDFSHIHARYRRYNNYDEFCEILGKIEHAGISVKDMHLHVSGIDYGMKGEKSHLNLRDSDLKYKELLMALKEFEVEGVLICESPNLEEDALLLKIEYEGL
jgi:deoxyribonuclease-4